MTVPAAAAWIGVPEGTPMSIPWWKLPQRGPKGLVIGPLTGQIRPADDGVAVGPWLDRSCAARIAAASWFDEACSCAISSASAWSFAERFERVAACSLFV